MKAKLNENCRVQVAIFKTRINLIQSVVCEHYEIPVTKVQHHGRKSESVRARRFVRYFCVEFMPHCPLSVIGLLTGNGKAWDHSTISLSRKQLISDMTLTSREGKLVYPEVSEEVNKLRGAIKRALVRARFPVNILQTLKGKRLKYHYRVLLHARKHLKKAVILTYSK